MTPRAQIASLNARIGQSKARITGQDAPVPPVRPYIPEAVIILLDGTRFVVACQSWLDCLEYAEWVYANGYREARPGECTIYPPSQVKRITARQRSK